MFAGNEEVCCIPCERGGSNVLRDLVPREHDRLDLNHHQQLSQFFKRFGLANQGAHSGSFTLANIPIAATGGSGGVYTLGSQF